MAGSMRGRFGKVTIELLDAHENLAIVTADISAHFFEESKKRHPHRVINVGIREQLLIGVAGGLALTGMRPIAHTFAPFLIERPFEQIKFSLTHQDVGSVLVSSGASYDIAAGGRSHQSSADIALLDTLPGWNVCVPGHPDEAERHLRDSAVDDGLVYIRLSSQGNDQPYVEPGDDARRFRALREGRGAVVIAVGPLCDAVRAATADLDITLLYASRIRPFDARTVRWATERQGEASVVIVEPYLAGTSVAQINDALADRPSRVLGIGVCGEELRRYGTAQQHALAHGLDPASLRTSITHFLGANRHGASLVEQG